MGKEFDAKIEAIYPNERQILLNGTYYALGDKIRTEWYKPGDEIEVKASDAGVIFFMKKKPKIQTPPPSSGFTPANQLPRTQDTPLPPKPKESDGGRGMMWSNAVNAAVELMKIRCDGMATSDIQTMDLVAALIGDAERIFTAGSGRVNG